MSNEFDPENVERLSEASIRYSQPIEEEHIPKFVRASDYDQLLALYRQLQQSTAILENLYAARNEELEGMMIHLGALEAQNHDQKALMESMRSSYAAAISEVSK